LANLFQGCQAHDDGSYRRAYWLARQGYPGGQAVRTHPRKHSYDEHDPRAQIFRPVCGGRTAEALRWRDKLLQVAREYNTLHKKKASARPLGSNGLWVLEVLLGFVDFTTGRCDPAIDTICAKAVWPAQR
jgi:hypothetical protein